MLAGCEPAVFQKQCLCFLLESRRPTPFGKFWYSVDTATCCMCFLLESRRPTLLWEVLVLCGHCYLLCGLYFRAGCKFDPWGWPGLLWHVLCSVCHVKRGEQGCCAAEDGRKAKSVQLVANWPGTLDVTCELAGKNGPWFAVLGEAEWSKCRESRGFAVQDNSHGGCASAREMLWPYLDVDMRFSSYQSKY